MKRLYNRPTITEIPMDFSIQLTITTTPQGAGGWIVPGQNNSGANKSLRSADTPSGAGDNPAQISDFGVRKTVFE